MFPKNNLQPGARGDEVVELQNFLLNQGFSIPAGATGYYGNQTKDALTQWQLSVGIDAPADHYGFWGPKSKAVAQTVDTSRATPVIHRIEPPKPEITEDPSINIPKEITPENVAEVAEQTIIPVVEAIVSSGKTINPELTEADLVDLDPAQFLQQAELEIAPEFAGKFQQAKDQLTRGLSNIGYDLEKTKEENVRQTERNLETGRETLAGRGLAFSGRRNQFERETQEEFGRVQESAEETARRDRQTFGSHTESLLGTEKVRNLGFGNDFQLSSQPVLGSLTSERQYAKENLAKEFETQERQRRAFTRSKLSFA